MKGIVFNFQLFYFDFLRRKEDENKILPKSQYVKIFHHCLADIEQKKVLPIVGGIE